MNDDDVRHAWAVLGAEEGDTLPTALDRLAVAVADLVQRVRWLEQDVEELQRGD